MKLQALRRRLLIQYLATVGLLLAAAEIILYFVTAFAGLRELDLALRKEIEKLAAVVMLEPDGPEIDGKAVLHAQGLAGHYGDWQVLLPDGKTLDRTEAAMPARAGNLPDAGGGSAEVESIVIEDRRVVDVEGHQRTFRAGRLRTVRDRLVKPRRTITAPPKMEFDIRVMLDRTPLDEQLHQLLITLIAGFPVALALAGIGGVLLIRRAVRPVEEAFHRERRFSGAASHELRTPLTALRGEIDVTLRRARTAEEHVESLKRMDALVGRMTGIVEGLLVLSRAEAGHLLTGAGDVRLADLRAAIDEVVALLPQTSGVAVECTASPDAKVVGDGFLLALAVRNLVENALVHAAGSPVRVSVSSTPAQLDIEVRDWGRRTDAPPAQVATGFGRRAGLGLSIVSAIAQSHRGTVETDTLGEGGRSVRIRIPLTSQSLSRKTEIQSQSS